MINKMKESGFCFGTRKAIEKTLCLVHDKETSEKLFLFGNVVNNDDVIKQLLDNGVIVSEDVNSIPKGSTVVIRTHGVSKSIYDKLKSKKILIEDCTCINVEKLHKIVEQDSSKGYKIILVGKKNHPEIIGTMGWCSSKFVYIVEKLTDLKNINLSGKICVLAQTTCNAELWRKVINTIIKENNLAEIHDTRCRVITHRQEKAIIIAKVSDVMIVIGDKTSSNSCELYKICHSVCKNTFLISSLSDLKNNAILLKLIANHSDIGLVGSASTSDETILEIYEYCKILNQ